MKLSVLLIGESWVTNITEIKGVDTFSYHAYEVGTAYISEALSTDEISFTHLPCHLVQTDFPDSAEELKKQYHVVVISDCGANTFLLPVKTFLQHHKTPNKLEILRRYVELGGGLCMVGGYMSFMGIEGKGRYNNTPVEKALPVSFYPHDDRRELPEGVSIPVDPQQHPVLKGLSTKLPPILGYNRAVAKKEAQVILAYEGDPIIALMEYGAGRSLIYASDCAPHWCPEVFCESEDYKILWRNIVTWLGVR
jgi:uncharacterized membrane protein